eukprot:TRINITY_DN10531_c0_g1_i1.p1 TRINITY_DN10531_c0_g1~~TRINITY_DN10531_c0_g1_i1.p1  ORF type:complete len:630 (+),score=147.33 TRINITY_DN10531_c0_g1_i1:32-1891(+)
MSALPMLDEDKSAAVITAKATTTSDYLSLGSLPDVVRMLDASKGESIQFTDRVIKINERMKYQPRILMITNLAIYNLPPSRPFRYVKRKIPIASIESLTSSGTSGEILIHPKSEYDFRLVVSDQHKYEVLKLLRRLWKQSVQASLRSSQQLGFQNLRTIVVLDEHLTNYTWDKDSFNSKKKRPQLPEREQTEFHDSDDEALAIEPEEVLEEIEIAPKPTIGEKLMSIHENHAFSEEVKETPAPLLAEEESKISPESALNKKSIGPATRKKSSVVLPPSPRVKVTMDDFDLVKVIGRGAFGKVLLVRKRDTKIIYAMKILKKSGLKTAKQMQLLMNERNILEKIQHPFIMGLRFAFQTSTKLYFVTDFYKGGDLFFHIQKQTCFTEDQARILVAEIALALGHLHACNFVYRDLKPENILLDEAGHACLTDFGLSKDAAVESTTFCGTYEYFAPEIINGTGYGKAVDWWALGVLLYELVCGIPPFHANTPPEVYRNIHYAEPKYPAFMSAECRDLIAQLLNKDVESRLGSSSHGFEDVKAHPFFSSIEWSLLMRKQVEPLYKPCGDATIDADDTSLFDVEFTSQPVVDTPEPDLHFLKVEETSFNGFSFAAKPSLMARFSS